MERRDFWVISDTHLGHNRMVEKGYRQEGFEQKIISNIQKIYNPGNIIIHLGDVSFYRHDYWTRKLTISVDKLWLVRGNHDKQSVSWYLNRGCDMVCDSFLLEMYGKKILFSHQPQSKGDFDINIHGHLHDCSYRTDERQDRHCLVNIEKTMAPVSLQKLIDKHFKIKD